MRSPALEANRLRIVLLLGLGLFSSWLLGATAVQAAPGLCVGPVCGDLFRRGPELEWQLHLRIEDQRGQRERIVVDCRNGRISPQLGPIERGHAAAVARRACRFTQGEVS